jgi:hypothetical protein
MASSPQWKWIVVWHCDCLCGEAELRNEFLNNRLLRSEYCEVKLDGRQWNKCEVIVERKVDRG